MSRLDMIASGLSLTERQSDGNKKLRLKGATVVIYSIRHDANPDAAYHRQTVRQRRPIHPDPEMHTLRPHPGGSPGNVRPDRRMGSDLGRGHATPTLLSLPVQTVYGHSQAGDEEE